ncbi:hypothetical protein C8R44DRAFT_857828 [Mycena epipterygia]|nr:hypothetical protein C8R44DRAFT_857828 [Mycena epipterygia]
MLSDMLSSSKAARATARARMLELDVHIDALKVSLQNLLHERSACEELLAYKYPILTLPNEITSEIFVNFLPVPPERPPAMGIFSPLLLCQICSQWRDVALSTPSIWSAIHLNLDDPLLHQQQLCLLEAWLERSKQCSLSIGLENLSSMGETTAFVEAIIRHCSRWADMMLVLPFEELDLIQGDMPRLRTLTFGPNMELEDDPPVAARVVTFDRAPNLKNVVLSTFFNPFAITLPWSQITTVAGDLYDSEVVEILRHTTNLEHFTLQLCSPRLSAPAMVPSLAHLNFLCISLHVLSIRPDAVHLLDSLTLPALQILQIDEHIFGYHPVDVMPSFTSFVSRTRNLQELHITNSNMADGFYHSKFKHSVANIYVV